MTPPLTPEQVSELRFPKGYSLSYHPGTEPPWWNEYPGEHGESPQSDAMISMANDVANGHLPPAILTAAWSIIDGTAEWRSHNGDEYENHLTEYAAKQDALDSLRDARDDSEWPDWIDQVEYGLWIPFAKATGCDWHNEDGLDVCDYRLEKVGKNVQETETTTPKA